MVPIVTLFVITVVSILVLTVVIAVGVLLQVVLGSLLHTIPLDDNVSNHLLDIGGRGVDRNIDRSVSRLLRLGMLLQNLLYFGLSNSTDKCSR